MGECREVGEGREMGECVRSLNKQQNVNLTLRAPASSYMHSCIHTTNST